MLSTFKVRRRPNDRLPLHRRTRSKYNNIGPQVIKRWILRLVVLCIIFIVISRYWITGTWMLSNYENGDGWKTTPFPELQMARNIQLTAPGSHIPKIVHFIHGLRRPEPTLDLVHYLAIKAAHEVLKPDKIMFHYHYMPVGEHFERIKHLLTLRQVPLVENIFGRPVSHYAHRADVVRLEALLEFGGIYLDLDLISLKPVDHLLHHEFVMAQEGIDGAMGLCNAMIMARPNARFLQRWYATYSTFESTDWNYHSVRLPGKLAKYFSDEVTVLEHTAFFWPLWDTVGLRTLYLEKSYNFSSNLGTHIWESPANRHLMQGVTEQTILNVDNSLYCQLRPLVLDGRPDPRPGACRILQHTEREDGLVGHWPLTRPAAPEEWTNPMRADDDSGNNVAGIIRNGDYDTVSEPGVHLTGLDSYIFLSLPVQTSIEAFTVSWWMKTWTEKENGTAVVLQTDREKIYVRTEKIHPLYRAKAGNAPISLGLSTVLLEDDWTWRVRHEHEIHANPFPINRDGEYHHFALVVDRAKTGMSPVLSLYMDGYIIAGEGTWNVPRKFGTVVRGVWFGSAEPEHSNYQDPWDTSRSLEAWYRDIHIWERALQFEEIQELYNNNKKKNDEVTVAAGKPLDFANAPHPMEPIR